MAEHHEAGTSLKADEGGALSVDTSSANAEELREPNAAMRKMLAEHWRTLNEEQKTVLRGARARRGICCKICGKVGFYREFCPNKCESPPPTPDSMASTPPATPPKPPPGLGILWHVPAEVEETDDAEQASLHSYSSTAGSSSVCIIDEEARDGRKKGRYDYKKKVDMNIVRPQAQKRLKKVAKSDEKVGTFEFFAEAEENYARNYAELSLHQVMRRLMRLLHRQLDDNVTQLEASFDVTLLHPPFEKDRETFYPKELFDVKEYRDYFLAKERKKEFKKIYKNQSSVRTEDEMDPLFRGGDVRDDFLYKVNPNAGASVHSKNTWKSILSTSDSLASSDPTLAAKQRHLQELFRDQSKWITMQQRGMMHKNDRYEHLVHILKQEIIHEHKREGKLLKTGSHSQKTTEMELYQDRLKSVDTIMNCLKSYNFTSGLDEADFLVYCLEKWKKTLKMKLAGDTSEYNKGGVPVKAPVKVRLPSKHYPQRRPEGSFACTKKSSASTTKIQQQQKEDGTVAAVSEGSAADTTVLVSADHATLKSDADTATAATVSTLPTLTNRSTASTVKSKRKSVRKNAATGYNRMIAADSPYDVDIEFLSKLKKKHQRIFENNRQPQLQQENDKDLNKHHGHADDDSTHNSIFTSTFTVGTQQEDVPKEVNKGNTSLTVDSFDSAITLYSNLNISRMPSWDGSVQSASPSDGVDNQHTPTRAPPGPLIKQVSFAATVDSATDTATRSDGVAALTRADSYDSTRVSTINSNCMDPEMTPAQIAASKRVDGMSQLIEDAFMQAHQHSQQLLDDAYEKEAKRKLMRTGVGEKNFVTKPYVHQRVRDEMKMTKARKEYRAAGMKNHIRKGVDEDWAYLAPALIPVPGAFQADGSNPMVSHTAENIMFDVKKNMILADIGYTPQSMVPLYVRNTLFEKNGTTPGGDQTQETMAKDRRYSHYIGRPLNRFEPETGPGAPLGTTTSSTMGNSAASLSRTELLGGSNMSVDDGSTVMSSIGGATNTKINGKPPIGRGSNKGTRQKQSKKPLILPSVTKAHATSTELSPIEEISKSTAMLSSSLGGSGPRRLTRRERREQAAAERQAQLDEVRREERRQRKLIQAEMQKVTHLPITKSLVRLAFKSPVPNLDELYHLDEDL